jgi:pimeloyl-ACP methyl ester carboxylesterase
MAEAVTLAAVSIRTGPAPTMRDVLVRQVEVWIGGVAATWFLECARMRARPAGPVQSSVFRRGYLVEQGEHPQTVGYALTEFPVGLAAWMLDHDPDSYDKMSAAFLDGQPTGQLTRDGILDNITLYWLTGTATSSARLYWEGGRAAALAAAAGQAPPEVSLPVAYTVFPGELVQAPRSWLDKIYPNLTYFNEVDRGGHFAAWEEPELFATEIRAAFRSLR